MATKKRGLVIHFIDGSKLRVDFPVQAPSEEVALLKLGEILRQRQIIAEVDGAAIVIPFENVKYFQVYPAPRKLPGTTILGASIGG